MTTPGTKANRPHHIEWRIDNGSFPTARILCAAESGSPCRTYCADCEVLCDHPKVDQGHCGVVPYFDDTSYIPEMYDGPDNEPVRDGDVDLVWDGYDSYSWRYAEAAQ